MWRITHKTPTAQKVFAKHRSSEDANDVEEEEEEEEEEGRRKEDQKSNLTRMRLLW